MIKGPINFLTALESYKPSAISQKTSLSLGITPRKRPLVDLRAKHPYILKEASSKDRRRQWQPTLVCLPGKFHGWRSLVGCSLWGRQESDMTERLHFHFSLSCIGEGNGNPLQCSCQENPRDGGAWWAAVYGVAQSLKRLKTGLKRLSSSIQRWVPQGMKTSKTGPQSLDSNLLCK